MPHYEQFKKHNGRKKSNSRNDRFVTMRSHSKMSKVRANSTKSQKINPLIIKLSIIVLIISLAFGFLKSGFKDISRIIKSSSGEDNISSIEGASGNAMRSDEEQMSILKDLTFRIFAKPQGDDSVIHEVITDNSDDSDYMSTVITRSALSYMTNNILTTDDENPNNAGDKLKRLFRKTSKDSNMKSSNDNKIVINDVLSYIPKIEFSDRVNDDIEAQLQENIYADNNNNSSYEKSRTDSSQTYLENTEKNNTDFSSKQNDNLSSDVDVIETKTFDRILSPKPKNSYDNNVTFIPAKSARRPKTDSSNEITKKEKDNKNTTTINDDYNKYSSNDERIVISSEKDYTDNNTLNTDIENTKTDRNNYIENSNNKNIVDDVNRAIDNNINNDIAYNNISKNVADKENESTKRSEIVSLDDINKNSILKPSVIKDNDIKVSSENDRNDRIDNIKNYDSSDNEKILDIDNTSTSSKNDNSLDRYIVDKHSDTIGDKQQNIEDAPTVNRDIESDIQKYTQGNNVGDSDWKININDKKENTTGRVNRRPIRTSSILKPSIFLAQYDDRYGTITIIPRERDMGGEITIEGAVLALLEGASEKEYKDNIISCISTGTTLLDLFVEDDTIYLNFNSDFEYNPLGDEGIIIQIYQIVYTVTQFEGIEKVVFLIDGQEKDMLGSDGQILNKVFTRMESENNIKAKN